MCLFQVLSLCLMSSSSSAVESQSSSWKQRQVSSLVKEASRVGGKSARSLKVRLRLPQLILKPYFFSHDFPCCGTEHTSVVDENKKDAKLHGFISLSIGFGFSYRHWLCHPSHRSPPECLLCGYIILGHFLPIQLLHNRTALGIMRSLLEHGLVHLRIKKTFTRSKTI